MKRFLKPTLIFVFALSWVFLFLWSFQGTRLFVRQHIIWAMGFGLPQMNAKYPEHLSVHAFRPHSVLKPVSEHKPRKSRFPNIEYHGHLFRKAPKDFDAALDRANTSHFVNLAGLTADVKGFRKLKAKHPSKRIIHFVSFNWKRLKESDDFGKLMARDLEELVQEGAKGIKLWKNFGLMLKDRSGNLIKLDDPRLNPVWDVCARHNLPVSIHSLDPPAFFRKIDHHNERFGELARRPEWSFFSQGQSTFDGIVLQRDNLFQRRRDVTFVAVHFAEFAHDLKRAGELLERHPNVHLDIAQRIDELGRQPRAAREFLIRWQDRIIYGTDGLPDMKKISIYWRFLETDDEYFDYHPAHKPRKGLWKIYGLNLPDKVLKKLYHGNASRILGL